MKHLIFLAYLASITLCQASILRDDFSGTDHATRQALRGEWVYHEGVASCVSDPELYKEFKNHGPILRWPTAFTDGTVEFEFKPKNCQRVVITLNEEGHVFRMALRDPGNSSIFGWIGRSSKENKSQVIAKEGVPSLDQLDGQWTQVKMTFTGDSARIQIGDYTANLKHGSIGRKKGEFTFSFAFGSCEIRGVSVK